MPGKIILTHALPGAGKTTWAEQQVSQSPEFRVRVNRDDIREELFGKDYSKGSPIKEKENQVTEVQTERITRELKAGKTVYIDDTNLNPRAIQGINNIAKRNNAKIEQKYFDVPVEVCKERNLKRSQEGGRFVPPHVIDQMAAKAYDKKGHLNKFIISETGQVFITPQKTEGGKMVDFYNAKAEHENPLNGKAIVLVDLDGTLAHNAADAQKYFSGPKKDYPSFFKSIKDAKVNENVVQLTKKMRQDGLNIVVLSGRSDEYAFEALSFIERSGIPASRVILKNGKDGRPDTEFKSEVLENLKKEGFIPVHSIDDRPRVIDMWKKNGITVTEVPYFDRSLPIPDEPPVFETIYQDGVCVRCGQPLSKGGTIGPRCKEIL